MDPTFKFPASPGTPLFQVSPERVNQQRVYDESPAASVSGRHTRESSVHDKVAQFNSLAFQGKQLERKANDAALKRAMLGREEAESEMRRYREETRELRRQLEEGKDRERRVGERLETVMENYGRAKETHAHTQTLWEKEIRRARKEAFKTQSMTVKLQEELKSARNTLKAAQADLEQEKERSLKREQEAFAARYQLVGVQEELSQMQENVKLVEQERDALRTIAKNEEIARIAAEGRLPLPPSQENDEFASPKKARKSLDPVTIISSAASEEEMDDLRMLLEWEQQRAERAHDRVEFLEMECRLNCCASRAVRELAAAAAEHQASAQEVKPRSSTIFIPAEAVFRTVSPPPEESPWISPAKKSGTHPLPQLPPRQSEEVRFFARTPSCEPPAAAMISDSNASLLSLLETPASPPRTESRTTTRTESPSQESDCDTVIVTRQEEEAPAKSIKIETFHTVSTTTRIPLANPPDLTPPTMLPSALDPALSPTMSREEALAMIRERRGRARSLAQGTMTPRKQMVEGGVNRRDISAPAIRSGNVRGRSQARVQV
ncbi:uncharacterized protein LY89DRAFT_607980 [Mollisia scopiformis]|uniref:Uncharacterized protein n=1 Tax=Mollisia scopiformis TaxID=149040 RepID=A0A194XNC8_MOLSC|nr:uncharacterized protein LY89DRAFT_607980 [Mollisia scopiformis]KUJ21604.1 hypothetical protein LY89DRAFT_607980 [Mollisia scopiformis]